MFDKLLLSLEKHPNLAKIVQNIGWLFFDKLLRMGVGLLVGVAVARYLGARQFGEFNYAMAFIGLFSALAGLGINSVVIRDLVKTPERANELLGSACILQFLGASCSGLIALGAIILLRPGDHFMHLLVGIFGAATLFRTSDTIKFWFEARVETRYVVWVENSLFLLSAAIKIGFILAGAPLIHFAWLVLFDSAMVAAGLIYIFRKTGQSVTSWAPTGSCAINLLRTSWPYMLSGLAISIYMRIDQVMLGEMLGDTSVGIYSAAVRISEVWYAIPMMIVASVSPSLITSSETDPDRYLTRLNMLYRLLSGLSLAMALAMSVLSSWIISLLFGNDYSGADTVLMVHVWAGIAVAIGVASSQPLLIENRQKYSLYRTVIGCILNILINLILIPAYGVVGAAWATVIAYFISVFSLYLFPDCRHIAVSAFRGMLFLPIKDSSNTKNAGIKS